MWGVFFSYSGRPPLRKSSVWRAKCCGKWLPSPKKRWKGGETNFWTSWSFSFEGLCARSEEGERLLTYEDNEELNRECDAWETLRDVHRVGVEGVPYQPRDIEEFKKYNNFFLFCENFSTVCFYGDPSRIIKEKRERENVRGRFQLLHAHAVTPLRHASKSPAILNQMWNFFSFFLFII